MVNSKLLKSLIIWLGLVCGISSAYAEKLREVRVEGLRYMDRQIILNALPFKIGDDVDSSASDLAIKKVYATGFFQDVSAAMQSHGVLTVKVRENQAIGSVEITGNRAIKIENIDRWLKSMEIRTGRVVNLYQFYRFERMLEAQYASMGLKHAKVHINVDASRYATAALTVKIEENSIVKVKKLRFNGNHAIGSGKIKDNIATHDTGILSWFLDDDIYVEERLQQDRVAIKQLYQNKGYLAAEVSEPEVVWAKDQRSVIVTFNITENQRYRIKDIIIEGDAAGKERQLQRELKFKPGAVATRDVIVSNAEAVEKALGDFGYGLAVVQVKHDLDDAMGLATIKLHINPGHRAVVRHINFKGNVRTLDGVLRREMRFQEAGSFSRSRLDESRRRLANLGYIRDVSYQLNEVPDTDNQVDLDYIFKEESSASMMANVGITNHKSIMYGAGISDINFLGTGKSLGANFNNSNASQNYQARYFNPYFTSSGVGFGVDAEIEALNPHRIDDDLSGYRRRIYGLNGRFVIPVSDHVNWYVGMGVEYINIPERPAHHINKRVEQFLDQYGDRYREMKFTAGINYSHLDRRIFPREGTMGRLNAELYVPFSDRDLGYYRVSALGVCYQPIYDDWIFKLNAEVAYGNGYGRTKELPFFRRYYAGGLGSVRGFEPSNLSPYEDVHRVIGGNFLTIASASLIVPSPFPNYLRISAFVDAGNVFSGHFDLKDIRVSTGVQLEIYTPYVPIVISFAKPIRKKFWDDTEVFQFSLGLNI